MAIQILYIVNIGMKLKIILSRNYKLTVCSAVN